MIIPFCSEISFLHSRHNLNLLSIIPNNSQYKINHALYLDLMFVHTILATHPYYIVTKITISIDLATQNIKLFPTLKHSKVALNIAFYDFSKFKKNMILS